jgi:fatty acyl-CoA reductase
MSEISVLEFFKGKTVFISGGTGFMGKVLIEKLLYSCPGLFQILMIIRPKKGKTPKQRIDSIISLPVSRYIDRQNR